MKTRVPLVVMLALAFAAPLATMMVAAQVGAGRAPARPEGPCDVYAAGGAPCAAAHSSTRAMYAAYNGPLYQVLRQSDGKALDIGVVQPSAGDAGGYADAAAQDAFCANTTCWITTLYDQSGHGNNLVQPPHGGFSGPAMGGFDNLPVADMAPVTIMGHRAYGVFIEPGMGLRWNNAKGTAVDDQAEGQYWVINGHHYNSGCCFDYGNAETDSRDDGNGTMETTYYGNAGNWYHGPAPGPWIMTDQENNLTGCVTDDGTKNCNLPIITWRFVTAMAKGEAHHWTSLGGDAQTGELKVMFDGPRINRSYDPMRKQGAILLGNGGDNSNGSQGTFYEGAMTGGGTFPSDATDQKVQANVVAAGYNAPRLSLAPASATAAPPGLQTFSPGSAQDTTVTFTNDAAAPATGVRLSITLPAGWSSVVSGGTDASKTFADPVAPGASVSATFKVTSGPASFNGDMIANASWMTGGQTQTDQAAEKVRNVSPIKINEFSVGAANAFVELYNAGSGDVDISNWTLTAHPTQQAIFSAVKIPAGTKLASRGFYTLGLSSSGLAVPARKGDTTIYVRSTNGMKAGDTIEVDTGSGMETRRIATLGTAAGNATTLWQPLPDGPVITIPPGSTSVPVSSVGGFAVGEKIGIGYGTSGPAVARSMEAFEVVTVTEVGKPGTQSALAADAKAGDSSIRIRNAANISAGDRINLDIDSAGHGTETVTVKSIETPAGGAPPSGPGAASPASGDGIFFIAAPGGAAQTAPGTAPGGARGGQGAARGGGRGGGRGGPGGRGGGALTIELAAPLKFNHANNLPLSARGTGISFQPATTVVHASNEPVQPLGTGIILDQPLDNDHPINTVVSGAAAPAGNFTPNQWYGGPVLGNAGNMVLRDGVGLVADSLNFGGVIDPWAAEGYQGRSPGNGCSVPSPAAGGGRGGRGARASTAPAPSRSAARIADGVDTDSNCADFRLQAPTPGASNQAQ